MITGIGGLPGSGKSYLALEHIYDSLYKGKVVYTNMRNISIHKMAWSLHRSTGIARARFLDRIRFIDTWEMGEIWKKNVINCEVVLDEVMVAWLGRDWAKMDRNIINWFSQHRKMRVNFTYIAQSLDKVDSTLKSMTQRFIYMRNTAFWKFSIFRLPQMFLAIHFAEDNKNILKREWIIPIKKFYNFYDSWAIFPSKKPAEEGSNIIDFPEARSTRSGEGGAPVRSVKDD